MSTHVSHREVWYTGRVQGVGFRAGVLSVSRGYEVTGYVQNLTDGRVYLHAEGAERELEGFLEGIAASMDGHVRNQEVRAFSGLRTCSDFSIRR
ncbi:MAG: acylphosphatase [Opitutales bacterium]